MLRNYVAAALRHLARNPLYSGITIFGLAVGLCAASLAGVVLRNELTYEHFLPGYERTYLAAGVAIPTGHAPLVAQESPAFVASLLKLTFPQIRTVTRIVEADVSLRHDRVEANEKIYWADPNAFELLPLPAVSGDLQGALRRADGIVLTRSIAEKYFGRQDPLGQSILVGTDPMTVAAVIEDLPLNGTELETGIFASGLAAHSGLSVCDRQARENAHTGAIALCGRTYLQLAPGTRLDDLQRAIDRSLPPNYPKFPGMTMTVRLIRIDRVHLLEDLNPGMQARMTVVAAMAFAILFGSCVIFVNLSTARSPRRALEVAIRKACGASRTHLILQFLGESLIYTALAACVGLALAHLALPFVNSYFGSAGRLDVASDPLLAAAAVLGIAAVGVLAGAYPALVLSAFRPSVVLKGSILRSSGAVARQSLVVLQFAILIGLLIATAVIFRQRTYAMHDALRFNSDQILILRSPCRPALVNELRALPGVRDARCSSSALLDRAAFGNVFLRDGSALAIDDVALDFGAFGLYGVAPLAGVLPAADGDETGRAANAAQIVINEAAAHRFGFSSASAAIGQPPPLAGPDVGAQLIVAVVPDFAVDAPVQRVRPTVYRSAPWEQYRLVSLKLTGHDIPETLQAIDRTSLATGGDKPADRFFLDEYIQNLYVAVLREAQAVGVFATIAAVLACLGLLGLSAATAESRTKEIGIRKAMGADTGDIVRMLLWQFSVPVLWASLLASLVSAWLLGRWLDGFSDHVSLNPLVFVAAAALAVVITVSTVLGQSILVARAKPVEALRYE